MDCPEVKELLSAYYDDELPSNQRIAVAEHLAGCGECARELEGFRRLSALAEGLTQPESPAHIWQQLDRQLDVESRTAHERPTFRQPAARLGLAAAAAILIAVGWFGSKTWFEHAAHHQMTAVFAQYLDEFARDPEAAQQILLAKYDSQKVDVEQVARTVGYRPIVAEGMPEGYSIESTYVMKMPCCDCVECLCKRSDGTTIAIFEHDDEDPEWFGDRPETEAICNGTSCTMVELDNQLAARWKQGQRHITVIGARDSAEVDQLVAWFDDRRRIRSL
jgi:hypothetical protein